MLAVYAFAAWTVFVWGTRVSNIVRDDGSVLDLLLALAIVVLGVAVAVAGVRRRPMWPLTALVVATVLTWLVRTPLIVLDAGHAGAFKAVHTALAVVSLALAALAWRSRGVLNPAGWPVQQRTSGARTG